MKFVPEEAVESFLRQQARPSYLIKRTALPQPLNAPGNSFLGGLPKLPPHLDWPTVPIEGEPAGLWFAGQIDLSDVTGAEQHGLPVAGTLFFFCQDCWTQEGVVEGHNRSAVLYDPTPDHENAPRSPPTKMVPINEGYNHVPYFIGETHPLQRRSFRFDVKLHPFVSYPDFDISLNEFEKLLPLKQLSDGETRELEDALIHHEGLSGWGSTEETRRHGLNAFGLQTMWAIVCSDVVEEIRDRLVEEAFESVGGNPNAKYTLWNTTLEEASFCWLFVEAFARSIMRDRYAIGNKSALRPEDASHWVQLATRSTHEAFSALPEGQRKAFLEWANGLLPWLPTINAALDFTLAVASETGRLTEVPAGVVQRAEEDRLHRWTAGHGHEMLGWGSSDHAAIAPDELVDNVILLKLSHSDQLLCGYSQLSGHEGVVHFWIDPAALARLEFSSVVCTC